MAKRIARQILDIRRDKQEFNLPKRSIVLGFRLGEENSEGFQYPEVIYAYDDNEKKKEVRSFLIVKDNDLFEGYILYLGSIVYTNDSNVSFLLHGLEVE